MKTRWKTRASSEGGVHSESLPTPLAKVFSGKEGQMPKAFREQFLAHSGMDHEVFLEGHMHRIWHRPGWLRPLFGFLGRLGILVPRPAQGVPTTLRVRPGRLPGGDPYHEWNRTFNMRPPVYFDTRVVFDKRMDNLADQVGPGRIIHMVWKGTFSPPRMFTLETVTNAIRIGGRPRYLPGWLWPILFGRVDFVQEAREDDDSVVDVDLRVDHPWFGEVFGYTGTFRAVRRPIGT